MVTEVWWEAWGNTVLLIVVWEGVGYAIRRIRGVRRIEVKREKKPRGHR